MLHARAMPSIAELARPEIRMAGLRWNPRLAAAVGGERVHEVQLIELTDGRVHRIDGLPNPLSLADWSWSPDGQQLAFSHHDDAASEVQLWCVEVQSRRARRLVLPALHAVMGAGFVWASDSQRLLLTLRPEAPWPEPEASASPGGPVVEEASPLDRGRQTRTFADLLRSEHDERLLEHHLLSQLAWVDLEGGLTRLGEPALHQAVDPSPDGLQLLVQRLERPFSHRVPAHRFARCIEVLDASGALLHTVARLDAADRLPSGFDAVPPGPREVHWRADADACLAWVEAADGGDPDQVAQVRDQLWLHAAPFSAPPRCIAQLPLRFGQVAWADGGLAVVTERWWRTRAIAYWRIAPDKEGQTPRRFYSGSLEDRYADPGQAVMRADARGRRRLLAVDGDVTTWTGTGASPQGDRPFVDRWNLSTDQKVRVFQSDLSHHDVPVAPLDDAGSTWLSTRETPDEPPQYRVVVLHSLELARDVTHWPHPTPQLRGLHRQTLHYRRADGVTLNGTLWLPPGHDPHRDGPLPTLVWAYPMEFISTAAAGQVDGSPLRFNTFDPLGPAVMVVAGYAVLDNPSMPIIGSADSPANDSFVPQLVANAQAAVDELVRLGVAEPHRIAIGGHSFGAFMAANLLAHSRLFCAGIARSGAYNRTLTPFGFQSEERHFWQAREMYRAVSPFDEADKIHAPLLLIHGLADANSGTFPMQSERMFAALRGLGSTARLVLLPHEGHRYVARESILHVLAETLSWLDQHVSAALPQNGERLGVVSTANSCDR
ncbi:alpha/beta hydrolase family protein [Roseateles toxinivorans]|nr:prolyl oligopeptidase family serine peptidase [Roseateles toxinivorans]